MDKQLSLLDIENINKLVSEYKRLSYQIGTVIPNIERVSGVAVGGNTHEPIVFNEAIRQVMLSHAKERYGNIAHILWVTYSIHVESLDERPLHVIKND